MFETLTKECQTSNLTEMWKLAAGLVERHICFTIKPLFNGLQIVCDDWDAICHCWSMGHNWGGIEIAGSLVDPKNSYGDTVEGFLYAEEILNRL